MLKNCDNKNSDLVIYIYLTHLLFYADVLVDVLEELDLNHLRSTGLQPGEQLLPSEELATPGC